MSRYCFEIIKIIKKEYPFDNSFCGESDRWRVYSNLMICFYAAFGIGIFLSCLLTGG